MTASSGGWTLLEQPRQMKHQMCPSLFVLLILLFREPFLSQSRIYREHLPRAYYGFSSFALALAFALMCYDTGYGTSCAEFAPPKIKGQKRSSTCTCLQRPTDDLQIGTIVGSNGSKYERNPDESGASSVTDVPRGGLCGGGAAFGTDLDTSGRSLEYRRTDAAR